MRIDIISLFPEMFAGPLGHSMLKRAQDSGLISVQVTNPRNFTYDKHHIVDDSPFGGGNGMVMKPEPIFRAVKNVVNANISLRKRIVLMCPGGSAFDQAKARELAGYEQLIFICGHYEGIDARIREHVIDEAISIGDYVVTGGELPAMVVIDAVARMIPGVLGAAEGAKLDSFYNGLLEYPQYTRPREFNGWVVPDVLLSGDHAKIERWRRKESLRATLERRPDLLDNMEITPLDNQLLQEIKLEQAGG
ncbi:tRNA (guanosine(37)-N1)-methyltransferase TrmD [Sporomusa acidovorans]|uniref:tRNA (guanine-N(1)-)-methyltransferase n=1 Tax=Sporomusa acidovorans (strain ATCC 49682 / DSM 3132 / Mol) TaxID=1123286 RepID=A0ABZ3J373_SPOA4|nr:tRNA (guanosine(37)-N1)-methyltransferase TrmD [Sporomusa acidovorans]OZC20020.1 tRNA (guanine-N(1)-)-methyltransferase [Sporomusa acidovorans DSM 3132]SDD47421.1 tRNA (Guanine37-N(1)-) methyltransferase [Sporomusa acidovorans]